MHAFHSLFGARSRRRLCLLLDRRGRSFFLLSGLLSGLARGPLTSVLRVVPAATPESGPRIRAVVLEAAGVNRRAEMKNTLRIGFYDMSNSEIKGKDGVVSFSRDSPYFTSILKFDLLIVTDCLIFLTNVDRMLHVSYL